MTLVGDEAWAVQWKELLERCGVQSTTALPSNPARWESADVVVLYFLDVGFWTPERLAQLDALLERGGGAVFCNAAIYSEKAAELAGRTGLAYDPEKTTWKQGRLLITFSKEHPLGRGLEGFDLVDTAFRPLAGQADVVAWGRQGRAGGESRNDGKNDSFPVLWTHEKGKGRVFGSTVGQFYWTFDDPLFRLAWLRGLAWAAGEPQDRFRALAKEGVSFR